jgi:hypothetical protein
MILDERIGDYVLIENLAILLGGLVILRRTSRVRNSASILIVSPRLGGFYR